MVATRARPARPTRRDLFEDIARGLAPLAAGQKRVDKEKKLIRSVKILGKDSQNGRRYTDEAIKDAYQRRLYEGLAVYVNHPAKPTDPRAISEKLGRVINIQIIEGELYGDLEYLENHQDAALICEMAERMDSQLGASHNAVGEGADDDKGVFVVRRIAEARSVDIVTEPATTGGLFEQRGRTTVAIKIRSLFENSWKKYSRKLTNRPRLEAYMKALVEDDQEDIMDDDVSAAPPAEVPADHEEALSAGFKAAIMSLVDECLANPGGGDDCKKKIQKLLNAHGKLANGSDREEEDLEEEDEEKPADKKEEAEEQRKRIVKLERENLIHRESGRLGVVPDEVLMESLMDAKDEKRVKKLLEREKERGGKNANPPRSGAGGNDSAKTVMEGVETPEGFLQALLG